MMSFLLYPSACCLLRYSVTCLAGNSVSQTYPKSLARWIASPSTKLVSRVTLQAFLLPAGSANPNLSSLSRSCFPPFFDFALKWGLMLHLLRSPHMIPAQDSAKKRSVKALRRAEPSLYFSDGDLVL